MKKLNWFIVSALFAGATLFTGCEETTDEDAITISASSVPETVEVGVPASLQFSVIADAKIESIELRKGVDVLDTKEDGFTNDDSDNYSYEFTADASDAGTTLSFRLVVTDKKDNVENYDFSIEVEAIENLLTFEKTGSIIGNKIGPDQSAWNLVTNVRESGSATSDMQNPSIADGTVAQQWIKGWDSENETRFVKANDYDYENASAESAAGAFSAGTATDQVRDVVVNDIYIAKIRSSDEYAVIKITRVDDAVTQDGAARDEEIEFTYKKSSETAGS